MSLAASKAIGAFSLTSLAALNGACSNFFPAKAIGQSLWNRGSAGVYFDNVRAGAIGDFLCRKYEQDPIGPILNWQANYGPREDLPPKAIDPLLKGLRAFLSERGVSARRIGVRYDDGLKLDYKIRASIHEKDRIRIISALVALSKTTFSFLSTENELGNPVLYIGPYRMVLIPAGVTARGEAVREARFSGDYHDCLSNITEDIWFAETATTAGLHRLLGIKGGDKNAPADHPATRVSWNKAVQHIEEMNKRFGTDIRLPTFAESEHAVRGPWVNIAEQMKKESVPITQQSFIEFVKDRYEFFVKANKVAEIKKGAYIFTDPKDSRIPAILKARHVSLFGLRQFGTRSGRLAHEEAWYGQEGTNKADWGPSNGWGLKGTCGGVGVWVQDTYHVVEDGPDNPDGGKHRIIHGCTWQISDRHFHRADADEVIFSPDSENRKFGFRVVAPV